jgi:hypothetical protein
VYRKACIHLLFGIQGEDSSDAASEAAENDHTDWTRRSTASAAASEAMILRPVWQRHGKILNKINARPAADCLFAIRCLWITAILTERTCVRQDTKAALHRSDSEEETSCF